MNALMGNEVCSETIVIRSTEDWDAFTRTVRYDGERYEASFLRTRNAQINSTNDDSGLFPLVGASS